jgi:hypothetical protein
LILKSRHSTEHAKKLRAVARFSERGYITKRRGGPWGAKPTGSSEVLAFYKQYNQREKLIKENIYILFDYINSLSMVK